MDSSARTTCNTQYATRTTDGLEGVRCWAPSRRAPLDRVACKPEHAPASVRVRAHRYILPTMLAVIVSKFIADAIAPLSIYEEHINLRGCAQRSVPPGLGRRSGPRPSYVRCRRRGQA
jgi:hypothetical protein